MTASTALLAVGATSAQAYPFNLQPAELNNLVAYIRSGFDLNATPFKVGTAASGQAIFEGLKAYRQPDGSVATFRADANAARFQVSASRMAMAPLPAELFGESLAELVRVDERWVPAAGGGLSLDEKFFPHGDAFRGRRVHQVRLGGGDASSDSYCYPS